MANNSKMALKKTKLRSENEKLNLILFYIQRILLVIVAAVFALGFVQTLSNKQYLEGGVIGIFYAGSKFISNSLNLTIETVFKFLILFALPIFLIRVYYLTVFNPGANKLLYKVLGLSILIASILIIVLAFFVK